jgi:DNA-directed RNA polymerase subunit A'
MPPKFVLGAKKPDGPIKKFGFGIPGIPGIPTSVPITPILSPTQVQINLEDEVGNLQKINRHEKNMNISNTEDIEAKMVMFSITGINFKILNKETLDKLAVVDVSSKISRTDDRYVDCQTGNLPGMYSGTTCTKAVEMSPPENSVVSYTEMGVMEDNVLCPKCNKTNVDCPGHLGQISLNRHFIHPMFMEFAIRVLASVCNSCSKLLVSESYIKQMGINNLSGKNRLKKIWENTKHAPRCENSKTHNCVPNPEYIMTGIKDTYKVKYIISKKDSPNIKEIDEIEKIFDNISNEDAVLLGFQNGAHPRDMIMKSFAVIPPCARPFTIRDGQRKEDHLTTCYDEIVRDNFKYARTSAEAKMKGFQGKKDEEGIEANCKRKYERDLHFHISHFIDNHDKKYCRSPTEQIIGIKQRITKKEGLIRGNIMGKRVNFCGRSVLGPDSTLKIGEIAIPESMAKVLSVPEIVHEKNIDFIRDLWEKRKINNIYPGYGEVKIRRLPVTEKTYNTMFRGQKLIPNIGDKVDRQLMDGDVVLANRQPTLYKYSMVGNVVKITDRKTLGIHMCETKMRNADFDGDDINIHVVQDIDARVEAYEFANTKACIPSALNNASMIGMLFNALSSAYLMTQKDMMLNDSEIKEGHSKLSNKEYLNSLPKRLKKHNVNPNSGRALFSALLPPDFQYEHGNPSSGDDSTEYVLIKDGVLVKGRIAKPTIERGGKTIQISIWKWYGQDTAVKFITDCVFLTDWFIEIHGLSIGYEDICPPPEERKNILIEIQNQVRNAQIKIDALNPEKPTDTILEKEHRERTINGYLNMAKGVGQIISTKILKADNPLNIMSNSGAKGNVMNTSNITGLLGQNMVSGARPAKRYSQGTRCIPYFDYNSEDIRSRGFCENNFLSGLTPADSYFLSEATRVTVANSAITTADTGHMHHRLVKVMEDVKVEYDGSVRNARGTIYQFAYYDGYDVGEITNTTTKTAGEIVSFISLKEAIMKINAEFD